MPTLNKNITERTFSEKETNTVQKITQALLIMKANGVNIILTYNENSVPINETDPSTSYQKSLPVGFGKHKNFPYSSSIAQPISFIMDVNGSRKPNSEETGNKGYGALCQR